MAPPSTTAASRVAAAALLDEGKRYGSKFLAYIEETGSPYHAVHALQRQLLASGFSRLDERQRWSLQCGGKYFVTRNEACIGAFVVGSNFQSNTGGFTVIATHADSPCLRLRPNVVVKKEGTIQTGVECYGGGLWHTWFDRGLGFAGKVLVKEPHGGVVEKFILVKKPFLIIPNLAIHLRTATELSGGFKVDKEQELQPILCTEVYQQLLQLQRAVDEKDEHKEALHADKRELQQAPELSLDTSDNAKNSVAEAAALLLNPKNKSSTQLPEPLLHFLATQLQVDPEAIVSWDLCLMDATPSRFCGINEEFIESPRLDNLMSTWAAFYALQNASPHSADIALAVTFDHEEIGSVSFTGAASSMLETWMKRILDGLNAGDSFSQIIARSMLLSADMAHAVHPNYADRHQVQHKPHVHCGLVVKENANQRYATEAAGLALVKVLAEKLRVPLQLFVVRNDSRCGSTVGPSLSAALGIRTIDVGTPQWGMHSCRETCGVLDLCSAVNFFKGFYSSFREVDNAGSCQ